MNDCEVLNHAVLNQSNQKSSSTVNDISVNLTSDTLPDSSTISEPALPADHLLANITPKVSSMSNPSAHPDTSLDQSTTNVPSILSHRESSAVLALILLLTSGQRHHYKIDEQYLASRNIQIPGIAENGKRDPYNISIYTLKELILREWKEEWGIKPSNPSSIRLIFFGRLLEDNLPLKNCRFNDSSSNVVHMSIRPQDLVDEKDPSKTKNLSKDRENRDITAGCRCVIM